MRALQVIHLIPSSPIFHLKTLNKFFQTLKQLLENSHISPTIEIAETHVSVHSSHHTPPGLMFGRFLHDLLIGFVFTIDNFFFYFVKNR